MSYRFHTGLVVGKFSPLHKGHEFLISQALGRCDELIIISYSKPELPGCHAESREYWLERCFPQAVRLVVTDQRLREWFKNCALPPTIPHNDDNELLHRRFVGRLCQYYLGRTVDAVFTSESYGDGFARELTRFFRQSRPDIPEVTHVSVDPFRRNVPISASRIRNNQADRDSWLSDVVLQTYPERICLLGGESTGKSTLSMALAEHFQSECVSEYGRELWEQKNGQLEYDDMIRIGETQVMREEQAGRKARRYLFCDTSPLTTLFYSLFMFNRADPGLIRLSQRHYDHIFLCAPDFPFVQDGTRQEEGFRLIQHDWYLSELGKKGIIPQLLTGPVDQRIRQVEQVIGSVSASLTQSGQLTTGSQNVEPPTLTEQNRSPRLL